MTDEEFVAEHERLVVIAKSLIKAWGAGVITYEQYLDAQDWVGRQMEGIS